MAWFGLLVGTLVGLGLLGSPVGLKPDQIALIWLGCGGLVELAAARLPRFGFCATGAGLWMGLAVPDLALAGRLGAGLAFLLQVDALPRRVRNVCWKRLADLLPVALAIGLGHAFGQPLLAPPLWSLFYWLQPSFCRRDWTRKSVESGRISGPVDSGGSGHPLR